MVRRKVEVGLGGGWVKEEGEGVWEKEMKRRRRGKNSKKVEKRIEVPQK